ncbi:two-component system sporulation sensor kinase B [Bacillus oleivorans]|uniref:histidine kinase n=1 Tax=Bacillus oleivorans TaxID=1448271 RepID=A0A285CHL4_9BACI|nr:ATP-binding protein [Bacillus oleivorans]SNX66835.1 two-component system sporulation sensor kinase B [Bacillus oleivorans]
MWDVIQDILINVLLILFPVLFYLVFLRESVTIRQNQWVSKFTIILFVSLLLTMLFPASYTEGFSYDLRIIPIIVAFLYGGALPGFILIGSMLCFTLTKNPDDFLSNLGNYLFISIILTKFKNFYHRQTIYFKALVISVFYMIIGITRLIYVVKIESAVELSFIFYLTVITWVTLLAVIFIIENMENQLIMQRELEHVEKMNTISQLAAAVAHEIRNPMTTVRGFLQMLNSSGTVSDHDKSYIKISIEELDRAQAIINDYLSISKPPKSRMEQFDLTKVLHDSIQIITAFAAVNNIHIQSEIAPSLKLFGFKHEIQQVLMNIMKNGIEAMDAGQTLEVSASEIEGIIKIVIKDQGCGIPKDELKWLGTAYFTNKENGTGLGLAVSYEIIKRMQGRIEVESRVHVGTTFTIHIPAHPKQAEPAAEQNS